MPIQSFQLRELFHLALLRHLGTRLSGRAYAVKGGICLRFFHRSPRLSEDIDLDVVSSVRLETLRDAVDSVIQGRALLAALAPAGVTGIRATKPKQTQTTQRWKVALELRGGSSLPTTVEFSRRRDRVRYSTGIPDAQLLRQHRMTPFASQFYDAGQIAGQKIAALASPRRTALRDLFDLHHILFSLGAEPENVEEAVASAAAGKARRFSFAEFKEQVLPYLAEELMAMYRDPSAFERQRGDVVDALLEMAR